MSLLISNYEMLESWPKNFHGSEHIFGIIHNLTYEVHVTILDGFITYAFLWPGSIQVFLIELNGWSVVNLIKCVWFCKRFCVCQHLLFIKYSYKTTNIFYFIFTCLPLTLAIRRRPIFLKQILKSIILTLSLSKTDGL